VTESSKGKATAHEDTVLEDSISKRICQHCATHDCVAFNQLSYYLPLTESRLPENMTRDPLSEFFLNKRTRIYARGPQGTYPQGRFLVFPTIKIQDPSTFCSK
jgi:hypothetical protein